MRDGGRRASTSSSSRASPKGAAWSRTRVNELGARARLDRRAGEGDGLVDELGGLRDAVVVAKEKVGLAADAPVSLKTFPAQKTLAQQLTELFLGPRATSVRPALELLPRELRQLHALATLLPAGAPLLVPPSLVVLR